LRKSTTFLKASASLPGRAKLLISPASMTPHSPGKDALTRVRSIQQWTVAPGGIALPIHANDNWRCQSDKNSRMVRLRLETLSLH
jgi:hypothetical protein